MWAGAVRYSKAMGRYLIKTNEGWITYAVYVAKTNPDICGKWFPGCEVHHIDGDRLNDTPENLVCLSKEAHRQIHKADVRQNQKRVSAYKNGVCVGTFESMSKAAKELSITTSVVSYYCKHGKPICNKYNDYTFSIVNDALPEQLSLF